jgi:hypothetical protein
MTPRLSVVVPFYNVRDYFFDCLDSIARQTYQDFEAILVDDGSSDGSADIAKGFCERDSRFQLVTQENQDVAAARNNGIRHASGELLAFIDSDDLITRHAYEKMIRTLDETGSSFVAGNARRFNNSFGVRQSWAQKIPFATDRLATHILEFPQLTVDRMVWNKVYRRSFWDEFGYSFPLMRYEDYPVALQTHLDAVTVDCLSVPVYYWRERESGESITQQKFKYANLLDRVTSAEMVIDMIDQRAPQLRSALHAHLVHIDLVALLQAFDSVPEDQEQDVVRLGHKLLGRLDDTALSNTPAFERLQHHALRAGDVDLLRRLARFRHDDGLRGGGRGAQRPGRRWQYEYQFPGLAETPASAPRRLYRIPSDQVVLATSVTDVVWYETELAVRGTAELRHLGASPQSRLHVEMVAEGIKIPLRVERFETVDSFGDRSLVGFEIRVDRSELAWLPAAKEVPFTVHLRSGRLHRKDSLRGQRPGSPGWPPGGWVGEGSWIQPGPGRDGAFTLKRLVHPWRLSSATVDGDSFVIAGRLPADVEQPRLVLNRTLSGEDLVLDLDIEELADGFAFTARIPMAPIVDDANPDDPFTQRTSRGVKLAAESGTRLLLWTDSGQAVSQVHRGRLLTLTRSPGNYANLHESPIRFAADEARVEPGASLVLSGTMWDPDHGRVFTWRRFLEDSDDHVDVACRRVVEGDRWTVSARLADLIPAAPTTSAVDPAGLAEWILFVENADGTSYAVQSEPFLTSRLPLEFTDGDNTGILRPRAGTLHLEVR